MAVAISERFVRGAVLLADEDFARLRAARVLVVGIGGVGSWCCEALVRTGIGELVFMDDDIVQTTDLNRQLPATLATLGQPKVDALARRLREVSSDTKLTPWLMRFTADTKIDWKTFDCVIDAIDSVADKAALMLSAAAAGVPVVSSMGAALRRDPTRVRVSPFSKVTGDRLARALRQRFRKSGEWPKTEVFCVHSDEPPAELSVLGSLMTVTATFGMALATTAIERILEGRFPID